MEPIVLSEIAGKVGYLTLNRPEKRNALGPEMIQSLGDALARMESDDMVKVVVLQANGKVFCSGADLEYLQKMQSFSFEENLADSHRLKNLFSQIYEFPKPVIAKVEGHALAGGCGLVTVCDYVIAGSEAKFGYPEVKIGFIPALVSVFLREKIGSGRAMELLLSGELISANKAETIGLISSEHPHDQVSKHVEEFVEKLVSDNSAFSMTQTKKILRSQTQELRHRDLEQAALANAQARAHEDCKKGIAAFLSKTKPNW